MKRTKANELEDYDVTNVTNLAGLNLVEHKDLLNFNFLAMPTFSPDSSKIAFKVSRANLDKNGYDTNIWVHDLNSGATTQLTDSGDAGAFCWSIDGAQVVFAKKDSKQCFVVPAEGGAAQSLFNAPVKIESIDALDDTRYLVTAVFNPEYNNPEGGEFMIFEQVPFLTNGKGYTGQRRTSLCLIDSNKGDFRRLTPHTLDVTRVKLNGARDAALIVGYDYELTGVKPLNNSVYKLEIDSGQCELLSGNLPFTFKCAVWAGKSVIVSATDRNICGVNENLKIYVLQDGIMMCLTPELDVRFGNPITCDTSFGCRELDGCITPSGLGVLCTANVGFKNRLCNIDRDGLLKEMTPTVSSIIDYDARGTKVAFVAYEGLHLPELYVLSQEDTNTNQYWNPAQTKISRVTNFNDVFFETRTLSQPIHIKVQASDGVDLDGWYLRPLTNRLAHGGRVPTILFIHGGPKSALGDIYFHEMQCWAARGYAVLYCNPRGSDGRGNEFSDIRGHYGDVDYRELMDFTDWCVKNLGFVDAARLGVTGGSYGGYMTNWIITQTNRFKAAVSQRGISNWLSKFGSCDIGYYYVEDQHLGNPWKDPENPWRESPLPYADRASTPTLFIHSTEDFRCELSQGFQMFTALKLNGVEARMCVFKNENHELSRSGKPRNRLARLREIQGWFDKHLK